MNNIQLRLETGDDYFEVENLTREAFWGVMGHPTLDGEHLLVHKLRTRPSYIPELDYIAETDGKLVGHVIYSRAYIEKPDGKRVNVITFGPLSVLPEYKRTGIGGALMRHTISEAKRLGHRVIIVAGHPDYYPRFGFERAARYGITASAGGSFDALMVLPLCDGALEGVEGKFFEDPAFYIDPEEAAEFDKRFPPKKPVRQIRTEELAGSLPERVIKALIGNGAEYISQTQNFSGREILAWGEMDEKDMRKLNTVLREHGYAEKLMP